MNQRPALTEREKELLRLMTKKCFLPVDRVNIFQNIFLPAFHELIGPKLETLNLSGFVDHCPYSERPEKIKQAILDIAIQAPQLVCLHVTRERNLRAELWEGNFTADDQIVAALSKLKELKVLQLEVMSFKLPDLLQLSQGLTHLRLISTNLTEKIALPDVEDLKESFEGLRVFLFWTQANQINRRAFTRFCIEHVPTLQVVGDYACKFCTVKNFNLETEELVWPGSSDLRHFTLDLNYEFIPINIDTKFKKINHLKIIWTNEENSDYKTPFRREELLTKLKKIPSLDLRGVPYIKILSLFFNNYGPTLLALHVTDVATHHVRLTYNQVFKHCPRLKKLCLDVDDSAQRITEKFPPLKELKLNLKRFKINSRNLWDVLKAPGLEKIELVGELTYPEDLQRLEPLLEDGRNLRKLKTLIVNLGWTNDTDRIEEKKISFEQISRFLKVAMKELRKTLTGVKFSLNDSCEFLQLFNFMQNVATETEIETSVGPSLKNVNSPDFNWLYDTELVDYLNDFRIIYFTI